MDSELLKVLLERAEQTEPAWHAEADNLTVRVHASTREIMADPDEAWCAAKDLRNGIAALGHDFYGRCRIGVVAENDFGEHTDTTVSMPIMGWRGTVELWFATQPNGG